MHTSPAAGCIKCLRVDFLVATEHRGHHCSGVLKGCKLCLHGFGSLTVLLQCEDVI